MGIFMEFPNPVLSSERDDYIEGCKFDISFVESEIKVTDEYIEIPANCELICEGLAKYVTEGKASVIVLIRSSSAFYRKVYTFDKDEKKKIIQIPKFNVKRNIEFCGYIVANSNVNDFCCKGEFNELYFKNMIFPVKKGDILAKGETRVIPIDDSELEKPITSIFKIEKDPSAITDIVADFDTDEKIVIKLSLPLNQLYWDMKDFNNGSLRRYLTGIIVYPVLVEALARMVDTYRENGTDYSEKRCFRTIERKAKSLEIDYETEYDLYSYSDLASRMLGDVAMDGLKSVKDTLEEAANSGEYVNTGGLD